MFELSTYPSYENAPRAATPFLQSRTFVNNVLTETTLMHRYLATSRTSLMTSHFAPGQTHPRNLRSISTVHIGVVPPVEVEEHHLCTTRPLPHLRTMVGNTGIV